MAAIEKSMTKAFGLDGEPGGPRQPVERLHRDPGRGGLVAAIWTYAWLGWRCLVPVGVVCLWLAINPRVFTPSPTVDQWASKAVLGERFCANRKEVPVPPQHRVAPNILTAINGLGLPFIGSGAQHHPAHELGEH